MSFPDLVVADYSRHLFHLIKGSASPPLKGLNLRLLTEQQAFSGQDLQDCLVVLEPDTWPIFPLTKKLLALGAAG
ncbi:MAG: hypothetical protein NC911_03305 [Candidatus Omnitrophica bacterium]|nr:hypothetical protein [Candidatus Omnitrophota bacterium]MCM8768696.1 hypothetical protein [Candidatus Omnitrophota bacterium]